MNAQKSGMQKRESRAKKNAITALFWFLAETHSWFKPG
jgi:hypothetical protein